MLNCFKGVETAAALLFVCVLTLTAGLRCCQLSGVLCSQEWGVFATPEDKIYFVNQVNQSTFILN